MGSLEGGYFYGSEHLLTSSIQIIDFTQIISPLWVYPKIDTTKKENDPYQPEAILCIFHAVSSTSWKGGPALISYFILVKTGEMSSSCIGTI